MQKKIRNCQYMICDNCGKEGARIRRISRSYGKGDNLMVIENVPVITCPHCGGNFLDAETLHEIEHIRRQRKLVKERNVPVAVFLSEVLGWK